MNRILLLLQGSTPVEPTGEIIGGWEYVIAAYVISAIVYGGYAYSVIRRDNVSRKDSKESGS